MIITFTDNDHSQKPDKSGFNKVGYVTRSEEVIFLRRKRIVRRRLSNIRKFPHALLSLPKSQDPNNVEKFFLENWLTLDLFNLGMSSLLCDDVAYFSSPIKLPQLEKIDKNKRDEQFVVLKSLASEADLLFTFDTKSVISKIISVVDRGPWSHVATCTGTGTIIEVIASGLCERPIEVYANPRYRLGLYRYRYRDDFYPEKIILSSRLHIGNGYSYKKAARAGLQKLFRFERTSPTPNDLAIAPEFELIFYT